MSDPAIFGVSIPFRIDPDSGGVVTASGPEKLRENLVHILLTGIGERVLRRGYGGGLRQLVHDPINDALLAIVQRQVAAAIAQYEPRVQLSSLVITPGDPPEDGTLIINLKYVVRRTRQEEQLAVPVTLGGV